MKKKPDFIVCPESLDKQFNDLFRVGQYGKSVPMKNPYNILWILENCKESELLNWQPYEYQIKIAMQEKQGFTFPEHEIKLKACIEKDEVIMQRMGYLIKAGVDINQRGSMIVKKNRLSILKYAVQNGLNINQVSKEGSSLLRVALVSNARKIQDWLWQQEDLDKNFIDEENCNYAILGLKYKNFTIIDEYMKNSLNEFLRVFDIKGNPFQSHKTIFHDLKEDKYLSVNQKLKYDETIKKILTYTIDNYPDFLYIENGKKETALENLETDRLVKEIMHERLQETLKIKCNKLSSSKI